MRTIVTGAAGFIGSRLASRLLAEGHQVTGIDAFTPYYDPQIKRANITPLAATHGFTALDLDIASADINGHVHDAEVVFHLAGQPGVRASWGASFQDYVHHNVLATQRILEAAHMAVKPPRIVFASSSSIYGETETYPTPESADAHPISPYGVTKLAAEHLIDAYRVNFGLEVVILRYFTVYGPGQRPDMGFHRFIEATLAGEPIQIFGDGEQVRDVTFVDDVVGANIAAATAGTDAAGPGALPINIAGGSQVSVNAVLELIGDITGQHPAAIYGANQVGDVRRTGGDISRARALLDYQPSVGVEEGLREQVEWHRSLA